MAGTPGSHALSGCRAATAESAYSVAVHRAGGPAPRTVLGIDTWAQDALASLADRPGVRRVGLALVEGGGRRLRFTASDRPGHGQGDVQGGRAVEWCDVDAYDDVPLNVALRSGAMVVGTLEDLSERFPDYVERQAGTPTVALAAVPVHAAGRPVGGYVLFFDHLQTFDGDQRHELAHVGRQLGTTLQRARLRDVPRATTRRVRRAGAARRARDRPRRHAGPGGGGGRTPVPAADPRQLGRRRRDRGHRRPCLSELVTNAVIHSHAGCSVQVRLEENVLTTTVRDGGTADAATLAQLDDPLQVHGRGPEGRGRARGTVGRPARQRWQHRVVRPERVRPGAPSPCGGAGTDPRSPAWASRRTSAAGTVA